MIYLHTLNLLFEFASLASLVALMIRNQIYLRILLLFAYSLYIIGEYRAPGGPAWEYIVWNSLFLGINFTVIVVLVYGRTTIGMTTRERELFALFVALSPGEFRKLIHTATWRTAKTDTVLTTEGIVPDRLYYIYDGAIAIHKGEREVTIRPLTFIGEIAFLRGSPASASVMLSAGSRWVEWSAPTLRRQLARDAGLRTGFNRQLGEDLAQKVAQS